MDIKDVIHAVRAGKVTYSIEYEPILVFKASPTFKINSYYRAGKQIIETKAITIFVKVDGTVVYTKYYPAFKSSYEEFSSCVTGLERYRSSTDEMLKHFGKELPNAEEFDILHESIHDVAFYIDSANPKITPTLVQDYIEENGFYCYKTVDTTSTGYNYELSDFTPEEFKEKFKDLWTVEELTPKQLAEGYVEDFHEVVNPAEHPSLTFIFKNKEE